MSFQTNTRNRSKLIVGVSGINAVDNPGPGLGVARALKEDPELDVTIVGLAYDAMEPGIYLDWLIDRAYIMPYPSSGREAFLGRLQYIKDTHGLDFLIPTLDAELPLYTSYAADIEKMGIKTFVPTVEQFRLRGKDRLAVVAQRIGIEHPRTEVISSYDELNRAIDTLGLPIMVKGTFYKAYRAYTSQEAVAHYNKIVAEWGYPVIVQQVVSGDEMNVIGVGDGTGQHLGMVGIKKMWITSLGKIWTGVTVKNEAMLTATANFIREYNWRGAFEMECIVSGDTVHLIEVNPRFPAWSYFATGVGVNLPANMVRRALDLPYDNVFDYEAGKLYIRYTYETITDMQPFQNMATKGEHA